MIHPLFDEAHKILGTLQKHAVSVTDLQKAYKRISPTRYNPGPRGVFDALAANVAGPTTLGGPKFLRALGVGDNATHKAVGSVTRGAPSRVLMTPGGAMKPTQRWAREMVDAGVAAPGTPSKLKQMSGAGKKTLNVLNGLHEQFEQDSIKRIAAGKMPWAGHHSHVSPEVIMKEHNMLRSLTGKGADEAREAMRAVRGGDYGEGKLMNQLLTKTYGPRAAVEFGAKDAPKVTKAMRKDLRRRITPEVLQDVALG